MKAGRALTVGAGLLLWAGAASAQASGFRADVLKDVTAIEAKYVALAEAMPETLMSWRPADGVRSTSEVLMHVALANFMLTNFIGVAPPADMPPRAAETEWTDRARVMPALKASFAHLRAAVEATPDADLDRAIKMFGQDHTVRSAVLLMDNHLHEHLGQLIAYARGNAVVPPWSAGGD
ncbi:MAG TPA: DinB family protein [Longimicrobiales bacterium]|nr:DinB family protein [Longimicrobiales bacterium]